MQKAITQILFLTLLLLPLAGFAQRPVNLDSLRTVIAASPQKDTAYLDQLKVLITQLFFKDPTEAMMYGKEHLRVADSLHDGRRVARSYNMLGNLYKTQGNPGKAIQQFLLALDYYEKTGDKLWEANVHSNMGSCFEIENRLEDALREQTEALKIRQSAGLNAGIDGVLGSIGNVYANLEQNTLALQYYQAAIDSAARQGSPHLIAIYAGNIANVYARMKDYPQSLAANRVSLAGHRANQDQVSIARVSLNIGLIYNLIHQPDSAIWYDKDSYNMAKEMGLLTVMQPAAANLMYIYDSLGQYPEAMKWAKINLELKDSLSAQMLKDEVREADLKYRMEREEREVEFRNAADLINKEARIKRQTVINISLTGGLLLSLSLAVVLFVMFRQKRQTGRILETKVEQRTRQLSRSNQQLSTEITQKEKARVELREFIYKSSHDLKGPLSSIMGLVQVATQAPPVSPFLPLIQDKAEQLDSVLQQLIHKAELEQHQLRKEDIQLHDLLRQVTASMKPESRAGAFRFEWDLAGPETISADPFLLRMALEQILQNAVDFSIPGKQNTIRISQTGNAQAWKLSISDTGAGMSSEVKARAGELFFRGTNQSTGAGLGLYLAREAAAAMGAGITIGSAPGEGTTVEIAMS